MGECNGSLTKEHVISKSVLPGLMRFKVAENTYIPTGSATVRLLCEYHNNIVISELDKEASKYFNTYAAMQRVPSLTQKWTPDDPKSVTIDGNKLERWFAKTFINMLAAKIGIVDDGREVDFALQNGFREYVFGKSNKPLEYPYGLWTALPHGKFMNHTAIVAHIHTNPFRIYRKNLSTWTDEKRNPQYLMFQPGGTSHIHIFMLNLSYIENQNISDEDIYKMFSMNKENGLQHRPARIGFSVYSKGETEKPESNEPDNIITFDWGNPHG